MNENANTGASLEREIEKIASIISTARQHLAMDRSVDLAALQSRVRDLCEAISLAKPDQVEAVKAALESILGDLDAVEAELIDSHKRIMAGLDSPSPKQATDAYGGPKSESE